MTFPSSGPGYPQQGGGNPQGHQPGPDSGQFQQAGPSQQPPQQHGGSAIGTLNIAVLLALATTVLGLVNYFIGFSSEADYANQAIMFLLVGGLLAAMRVLPNGPKTLPFGTLFSVLGGLWALLVVVRLPSEVETPGVVIVVLILGILQLLVAVAALLLDHGVLKMPAPKPQAGPYGQGPQQQFGPPQGRPGQQAPPSGGFAQPTQYGPPVSPPAQPGPPSQQPTQYASQQGQFYQQQPGQQPAQPGQENPPQQQPGTPPGGFGQQG